MTQEQKWLEDRLGKFTSSEIAVLLVNGTSGFGDGALTYIYEKVGEMLTGQPEPQPSSIAIDWGSNHEKEAIDAYIEKTGRNNVHYFGKENPVFFPLYGYPAGGSPDGFIENERVIEIKCPHTSSKHVEYSVLTLDDLKKAAPSKALGKYYAQCQMNMIVTNTLLCDFCSYDPRVLDEEHQLSILEIPFDKAFCDNLMYRIEKATELMKWIHSRLIKKAS